MTLYFEETSVEQKPLTDEESKRLEQMIERGGKGSGHHDHRGRRGKVGGSLPKYAPDPYDLDEKIGEYKYIVQGIPSAKPYFKALKQQKKRILERESGKFSARRQLSGINKRRKQIAKRIIKAQKRLDETEGAFWGEGELDQERIDLRGEIKDLRDEDRGLLVEISIIQSLTQRGGAGSGHHGHEGRPGEVGGSLPSGETWKESRTAFGRSAMRRRYKGAVKSMSKKLKEFGEPLSLFNVPTETRTEIIIAPNGDAYGVDDHDLLANLMLNQVVEDKTFALEGESTSVEAYQKWLTNVEGIPPKDVFHQKNIMMAMGFVRGYIENREVSGHNFIGIEAATPVSKAAKRTI
ncbi:MAG: hypothetical protein KAI64_07165, partial [Thermoplasmata archaeon]|nr:hypothetical protein [Thermoplasmata archaeon]